MTRFQQIEALVAELSTREKVHLFQHLAEAVTGAAHGIEHNEGVCGGCAVIANSRIAVWLLIAARKGGMSEAEMLQNWPTLRAQDLVNAWNYYWSHREEIERDIQENMEKE